MPFLPIADISNLFELFFSQNYPHTPTHYQPQQDRICSFPRCLFCLSLIFQICLNYFFPKIIHIPHTPYAMPRLPACPRCPEPPHAIYHIKAPSDPSLDAFFCLSLIFQICLNYFFPKLFTYPPHRVTCLGNHDVKDRVTICTLAIHNAPIHLLMPR